MLVQRGFCPARALIQRKPIAIFAPYFTHSAFITTSHRPANTLRARQTNLSWRITSRNASSASSQTATATSSSAQSSLTWDDFFALRRTRRRIGQACSGVGAIAVTYYGLTAMISSGYDSILSAQLGGLDPFMLMGLSTLGMMAVGWLVGPVFGNQVFNLAYRAVLYEFGRKDSAFFNRIKRHRVDPTASSLANPPPDYYGEKIGSVAGYRRWLKDQRAFNLKTGRHRPAEKSGHSGPTDLRSH